MIDVIKIIKLHVDYENLLKRIREEQAKDAIEELVTTQPFLANFHVFKNIDRYGYQKSFLRYKDPNGINYIFENVSQVDFLKICDSVKDTNLVMDENAIFTELASKYTQLKLEDLTAAEKRKDTSEEHLNNLKKYENESKNEMDGNRKVLGNEENGIYLNGDELITIHYNKKGEVVTEEHKNSIIEEEELGKDEVVAYNAEALISFEEYNALITERESLSSEEQEKIQNMENFFFEVITYKEYLTPELYEVCEKFYAYFDYLSAIDEPSQIIFETVNRYQDMQARSEERQAINSRNKVASLQRQLDNSKQSGFVNAILYVIAVAFIGVVIAVITILAK